MSAEHISYDYWPYGWPLLWSGPFIYLFKINLFILLYNIVLVLPSIDLNPPWVYMCSPSWTSLPPPSPSHPSGLFSWVFPAKSREGEQGVIRIAEGQREHGHSQQTSNGLTCGRRNKSGLWISALRRHRFKTEVTRVWISDQHKKLSKNTKCPRSSWAESGGGEHLLCQACEQRA